MARLRWWCKWLLWLWRELHLLSLFFGPGGRWSVSKIVSSCVGGDVGGFWFLGGGGVNGFGGGGGVVGWCLGVLLRPQPGLLGCGGGRLLARVCS